MSNAYRKFCCLQKTKDIYSDIAKDIETAFDTSNQELDIPLPKGKKASNWFDERCIRWEIMEELAPLMTKGDSYVTEKNVEDKKPEGAKKMCHGKNLDLKTINIAQKQFNLKAK